MNIEPYENLQAAFNVAYRGLASQGFERALQFSQKMNMDTCSYRTEDGRKCAIGHCVPDELVTQKNRFASVRTLLATNPRWRELFRNISVDNLEFLQRCHDTAKDSVMVKNALRSFAKTFGLTIPKIDPLTIPTLEKSNA